MDGTRIISQLLLILLLWLQIDCGNVSNAQAPADTMPANLVAARINDPIGAAYHTYLRGVMDAACGEATDKSELLHVRVDITGDGLEDVLVSLRDCVNGRAGNVWLAYVQGDGTFAAVPDVVTINTAAFYVVTLAETGERVIVTNYPGGGDKSALVAIRLRNGRFHTTVLAGIEWNKEDADSYSILTALLDENPKCTPSETPFSELGEKYSEIAEVTYLPVEDVFPGYYSEGNENGPRDESHKLSVPKTPGAG